MTRVKINKEEMKKIYGKLSKIYRIVEWFDESLKNKRYKLQVRLDGSIKHSQNLPAVD